MSTDNFSVRFGQYYSMDAAMLKKVLSAYYDRDTIDRIHADIGDRIAGKANTEHVHALSDVAGLVAALSEKAAVQHTHCQTDITGLADALTAKADAQHTHTLQGLPEVSDALTALKEALQGSSAARETARGTLSLADASQIVSVFSFDAVPSTAYILRNRGFAVQAVYLNAAGEQLAVQRYDAADFTQSVYTGFVSQSLTAQPEDMPHFSVQINLPIDADTVTISGATVSAQLTDDISADGSVVQLTVLSQIPLTLTYVSELLEAISSGETSGVSEISTSYINAMMEE